MFNLSFVIQLAFAHWVSDFVLQSGWMATNKSKNWWALLAHVLTYTASLMIIMLIFAIINIHLPFIGAGFVTVQQFFSWVAINGVLHFITDAITSRLTGRLWKKGDMHNFFVVVGFDQFIHYASLFSTWVFVLRFI